MSGIKPIPSIAVIGTDIIGTSWSSRFIAKGLQVVASDVGQSAETTRAATGSSKSALVFEEHIL